MYATYAYMEKKKKTVHKIYFFRILIKSFQFGLIFLHKFNFEQVLRTTMPLYKVIRLMLFKPSVAVETWEQQKDTLSLFFLPNFFSHTRKCGFDVPIFSSFCSIILLFLSRMPHTQTMYNSYPSEVRWLGPICM